MEAAAAIGPSDSEICTTAARFSFSSPDQDWQKGRSVKPCPRAKADAKLCFAEFCPPLVLQS